jgi:flavorubredoxin
VPEKRAVVLYDTMWDGTRRMAEAIGRGFASGGVPCTLFHMGSMDRNDAITEIFKAKAVVVGSPTVNKGLLPGIMPVLEDLRGLRFKNKIGAAFASYGWSGESLALLEEHLKASGIALAAPGVRALWQPTREDLARCESFGRDLARSVMG